MKKLFLAFPIIALLATGCNSAQKASVQAPIAQNTNITPTPTPTPTTQQPNHVWKNYYSSRLGFSIDYPSDISSPLDGKPQGEPDALSFVNNQDNREVIQINLLATEGVVPQMATTTLGYVAQGYPYSSTTLSGIFAIEQDLGDPSCPSCNIRFSFVDDKVAYMIGVFNNYQFNPKYYLSPADVERIRASFKINFVPAFSAIE